MSNGYVLAAAADVDAARAIAAGFGLEIIDPRSIGDIETAAAALGGAANLGLILSRAAAADAGYVTLLRALAARLPRAQLIAVEPDARAAFPFLPQGWAYMTLQEAQSRIAELARRRREAEQAAQPQPSPPEPPPPPEPEPAPEPPVYEGAPESEPAAEPEPEPAPADEHVAEAAPEDWSDAETPTPAEAEAGSDALASIESADAGDDVREFGEAEPAEEVEAAAEPAPMPAPAPSMPPAPEPPTLGQDSPEAAPAPPPVEAPPPQARAPLPTTGAASTAPPMAARKSAPRSEGAAISADSATADASAFAPKKLRRGAPELVQVVIHQPQDLKAVIKAARKADARTEPAPSGVRIGDVALGASIGVALEARGASCDGEIQRRTWAGAPLTFAFFVEAEEEAKQAVFIARVFVGDAQIGVIGFTRGVTGAKPTPAAIGDALRLKRHKRVFLSYSSKDREIVAAIATAYEMAGVAHFFDRTSLKSGEEWSPRLRQEIDRSDLFHLCWSKAAANSEWVEKEAAHALTRRKRSNGKTPTITVQMLDGPPWAPHPAALDSINFDDFVRAAIVGYARGEAES